MNEKLNSIGLNKEPKNTKVVVAMSGGVDLFYCCRNNEKEGYKLLVWL